MVTPSKDSAHSAGRVESVFISGVTDHAIDQFRSRVLGGRNSRRHETDDGIRESILKCLESAVEVEIPARFKIQSLLANDGIQAVYLWHGSREIMFVVSTDGAVLTCYPMSKDRLKERSPVVASRARYGGAAPRRLGGRPAARSFDPPPDSDGSDDKNENVDDEIDAKLPSSKRRYRRVRRAELAREFDGFN